MIRGSSKGGDFAAGLDVGTTKICAITGGVESGKTRILSVGVSPSYGLKKGIVVDIAAAADSIKKALENAETVAGGRIKAVYVGIAGGHIKGFMGHGAIGVKGGLIREEDVARLMDSASAVCVPVDREILHVIPAGFRLDGRNGVKDPVGMRCDRLEANVHIVTGSVTSVRNLIMSCEMAGVDVADIVLEPLASADAVLMQEEREKGVALVDIGGGTTDIAVYRGGMPRHTAVLAVGGNHVTNDIAVGLGISAEDAERMKKGHGYSIAGVFEGPEYFEFADAQGLVKRFPGRYLTDIVQMRCEELMTLVAKEISAAPGGKSDRSVCRGLSGVVLTGGTSLLKGIREVAGSVIGLPVRTGIPENILNGAIVNSPEYATGVGLVHYGLADLKAQTGVLPRNGLTSVSIFERMKNWVKEYF